ncbi:MAG: ElyC/SanA/YdcF family protein [Ferruginibacter sp.]
MTSFLYDLKGQATVFNGLFFLLIMALIFYRYKKRKVAIALAGVSVIIFLLSATRYLPDYLADKLERKYLPLSLPVKNSDSEKVLILVLGSGYTLDARLPANAQIGLVALGRLAEAIRINRLLKNSVLICSGYSALGLETQAEVTKRAAILLGVDSGRIETLNKPRTTGEEAEELGKLYDKNSKLIIVTDALHMPRAIKLFKAKGFNPIPAPTNFKINGGPSKESLQWWPSVDHINLMNNVIHEYLANLKASLTG